MARSHRSIRMRRTSRPSTAMSMSTSSESERPDGKRRRKIWLGLCRYDIVSRVALDKDYKFVGEDFSWHICWTDAPLPPEKIIEMRTFQNMPGTRFPTIRKMNHFPGMYEICRKDRLGRNLNRLKKIYPNDYNFFPPTWDLPSDMSEVTEYSRQHRNATFIVKPDSGCQGKGIFLVKNVRSLCPFAKCVCQLYIPNPFLIDGYKFDTRIYVLITSVDPLRIYLFNEGIARFATVKYQSPHAENLDVTFMHLTNYSLNKYSDSYDPQLGGSKRKLTEVYTWMKSHNFDVPALQQRINDIVVKAIVCVAPTLRHNYRACFPKKCRSCYCFDVLGFDILIDQNLTPTLLEVNHSPSLNVDLQVDQTVKYDLVADILDMLYVGDDVPSDKSCVVDAKTMKSKRGNFEAILRRPGTPKGIEINDPLKDQFIHEELNMGRFTLIFREECPDRYARFLDREYCEAILREQKAFMKRRQEPYCQTPIAGSTGSARTGSARSLSNTSKEHWTPPSQTTTYHRLPSGEVYAETKTITPRILDPDAFLKFKSSVVPSKPIHYRPLFSGQNERFTSDSVTGLTKTKPLKCKRKEDSSTDLDTGSRERALTPSQQVQLALDKLKQKNLQKFSLATERNEEIRRCNTSTSMTISEPSVSQSNLEPRKEYFSQGRNIEDENNNLFMANSTHTDLDEGVLHLDTSKLPSIFQTKGHDYEQIINQENLAPEVDEEGGDVDGLELDTYGKKNRGSSLDLVEGWINKGTLGPATATKGGVNGNPLPPIVKDDDSLKITFTLKRKPPSNELGKLGVGLRHIDINQFNVL